MKTTLRTLAAAVAMAAAMACDTSTGPLSDDELEDLAEAQDRWAARTFEDYRFEVRQSCFCAVPSNLWATIEVRSGLVTAVTFENDSIPAQEDLAWYPTVDALFTQISQSPEINGVIDVAATYDATHGYPRLINVNSSFADGGYTREARGMVALPE